ncbi:MAG TPA: alkaline phosphatase family protein, partial [Gemmatimonadales bacterium]|nr:alkaline phosphatase family protein [Gemmatimonadales bacterium]
MTTPRKLVALICLTALAACEGAVRPTPPPPPAPPPQPPPPPPPPPPASAPFNHVFIVVEENTNVANVIGNSAMPYLNGLARQYGLATQYYADTHPSIGNYFMLTVGDVVTNNDSYSGPLVTEDNVVRELLKAGKTWKSYAEDIPRVGYTGPDVGQYARRHNTLALLADVA